MVARRIAALRPGAGGAGRAPGRFRRAPFAGRPRGILLYVLMLPVVLALPFSVLEADAQRVFAHTASLALVLWGAAVLGRGLRVEAEFQRRRVANAPRVPRKLLGCGLAAAGVFVSAWLAVPLSPIIAGCLAAGAFAGAVLLYGSDPRAAKVVDLGAHGYTTQEVIEALDEAESAIERIERAQRRLRNGELTRRLGRITGQAREILDQIESDPRDLRRSRKFLKVYLTGAERVIDGYARLHPRGQSAELEARFRNVLDTIERVFGEQQERLLANNVMDLDVQIEVLATQLEREGVV